MSASNSRKILVFQHVANEILGTLNTLLKQESFRIRYVNFDREPEAKPSLEKYSGLIVLGGWMGVYESDRYPHLQVECKLIEEALKREIPILGICLGSQILAHTLGANVRKHSEKEVGWQDVDFNDSGLNDPLFQHFKKTETLFQMHGDTFDIPSGAVHLAGSSRCESQAFRYGKNAYGIQFHLEADEAMIHRFLRSPENRKELEEFAGNQAAEQMERETKFYLDRSLSLSMGTFKKFLDFFPSPERTPIKNSGHGKAK